MAAKKGADVEKDVEERIEDGLEALWEACFSANWADAGMRQLGVVIDAVRHAFYSHDSKELHKMEVAARRYMSKVPVGSRHGPVMAPSRHTIVRALIGFAKSGLADQRWVSSQFRASAVANALLLPASFYLVSFIRPKQPPRMLDLFSSASVEIEKALAGHKRRDEPEDPEDIVVAFLVAYGLTRRTARSWVQSAVRRSD